MKKRIATMVLVIIMICSLSMTAFADDAVEMEKEMLYTTEDLENVELVWEFGSYVVEDGVFSVTKDDGADPLWGAAVFGDENLTDYVVEFDLIQAIDGGIWFRYSQGDNGQNAYMLGSDGLFIYFGKWDDGVFNTMAAPEQAVPGGKPFAVVYNKMWDAHWKLVVEGNVFSAYVDGSDEPIIQATDSEFASGQIGFSYNLTLEGEPSVEIKNFEVYREVPASDKPDETDPPAEKPTDAPTEPVTDPAAPTEPVTDPAPSKAPVGLIVGIAAAVVVIVAVVVVVVKKKKSV